MMANLGHRHDFGKDWDEVVNNWCLGTPPPIPSVKAWEALGVLEHLWPEYLGEFLTNGIKGIVAMAGVIDVGLTLAACQNLTGFQEVLTKRIKNGKETEKQAALAEVRFAAGLVNLGYQPVLDKENNRTKPDALIISNNKEIFIDVISPQMSEDLQEANSVASTLAEKLMHKLSNQTTPSRLEVYLLTPYPLDISEEVSNCLDNSLLSASETVHTIPDIALIKYSKVIDAPNLVPAIPVEVDSPVIDCIITEAIRGDTVIVRYPFADDRLELLMRRKREKNRISKDEINILVIDLHRVPAGFKRWQSLARRRLQPNLNRRFSGIILFRRHIDFTTGALRQECLIEQHPNPYKKLPINLLNDLARLSSIATN